MYLHFKGMPVYMVDPGSLQSLGLSDAFLLQSSLSFLVAERLEGVFGLKEGGPGWGAMGAWRVQDLVWTGEQEEGVMRKAGWVDVGHWRLSTSFF